MDKQREVVVAEGGSQKELYKHTTRAGAKGGSNRWAWISARPSRQ